MPRKMLKIHESTSILEPEWNQRQIKTLGTRINTDFQRQNRLFELFFQFVASPVLHYFFLQNRIILMRFYLSFMWFQSWCTQIVPIYKILLIKNLTTANFKNFP